MMRRRFRRRSKWLWAGSDNLSRSDTNVAAYAISSNIFPVGRTNWLLDQSPGRRNFVTVDKILLWLDFHWSSGTGTGTAALPDVELFLMKTKTDVNADEATTFSPYGQPVLPSLVTSWTTDFGDTGLDAFLWTHWIKGFTPPNFIVIQGAVSSSSYANQSNLISQATAPGNAMCREFRVSQEYQPNVVVRTKRRLGRDETIIFGIKTPGSNSLTSANISYKVRVLGH